ncbi:unnamed protein product [Mytilus coruscus]|uniref:Hemicentin-1-like von Willebrand factor A domain-containing protein n=1 Tax=Mytilus coruscus TaxID=42192 RepID=A0A6J8BWH4_MYTCO|nr:unnamed protein product [Mytilus coruscus]
MYIHKLNFTQGRTKRDAVSDAYSLVAEGTEGTVYRFNTAELGDFIRQISEEIFPSATAIVDIFEIYSEDDDSVMFPVDNMLNNVKITVIGANSEDDVDVESPFGEMYTLFFTVYNLPVGMNVSSLRLKTSNSTTKYLNLVQLAGDFDSTYFVSTTLTADVNLYKNTVGNVSYTVENKGSENETFVVDVTDNRGLLTGQTSFIPLISSNGSSEIIFQINGSSLFNTVYFLLQEQIAIGFIGGIIGGCLFASLLNSVPNKALMTVAGTSVDTCQDCDNSGTNVNSCQSNLLVSDMLTSGYQTGQDVQPPYNIGIINELNVEIFAQIFGLIKRYQTSFGFVIDDTGSMGNNIEEVRKACIDIITDVFGTANAPSNYILVTFNDPGRTKRDVASDVYALVAESTGGKVYRFNTAELGDMMKQISENPTPGIYNLLRIGNNYWSVNITAQTSVDFHYLITEEAEDGYLYRISGNPIVDLYVNTVGQVSYTLENKGSDNETFVVDVIDDRGLLTGQTTFTQLINSNGFGEIPFQLQGSSLYNTVGDCCTPSAYLIVIDKNSNFARCHFYVGDIEYVEKSEPVLSKAEQIAIGVIAGIVASCLFASLIIGIIVYRKAIKPTLEDSKINPFKAKENSYPEKHMSNVFADLKCKVSNRPPIATTLQQPLELDDFDLE